MDYSTRLDYHLLNKPRLKNNIVEPIVVWYVLGYRMAWGNYVCERWGGFVSESEARNYIYLNRRAGTFFSLKMESAILLKGSKHFFIYYSHFDNQEQTIKIKKIINKNIYQLENILIDLEKLNDIQWYKIKPIKEYTLITKNNLKLIIKK